MVNTFAVGDTVQNTTGGTEAVVTYGPFRKTLGHDLAYLVRLPSGIETTWRADSMRAAETQFAVGDRVKSDGRGGEIASGPFPGLSGKIAHVVRRDSGEHVWRFASQLTPAVNTVVNEGITYDLSAKYRDRDDDVWRLGLVEGVARGTTDWDNPWLPNLRSSLAFIVRTFGPLTRV